MSVVERQPTRNQIARTNWGHNAYKKYEETCPYCKSQKTKRLITSYDLAPYKEFAGTDKIRVYECWQCNNARAAIKKVEEGFQFSILDVKTCGDDLEAFEKNRWWYSS